MLNYGGGQSRRCSICDINFPAHVIKCQVCKEHTWERHKDGPDEDWKELVAYRLRGSKKEEVHDPASLYIVDAEVSLFQHAGKFWVPHNDLLAAGLRYLESFAVVKIDGRFYELQGHVGKTANNFPGGAWWVEEIHPEAEIEKILDKMGHAVLNENPEGG